MNVVIYTIESNSSLNEKTRWDIRVSSMEGMKKKVLCISSIFHG